MISITMPAKTRLLRLKPVVLATGIVLLCLLTSFELNAKATGIGNEYPSLIRSVRALGMGNAFIAMPGEDPYAQFYNPAAINDYEYERKYHVGAPMVEFSPDSWGMVSGLLELRNDLKNASGSADKINIFKNWTQGRIGQYDHLATYMPLFHVRHKRYALGVVADNRTVVSLRNQAFPNFDFRTLTSTGIIGGSAYGFFNETLQVGANIKALFRMSKEEEVTTGDILIYSIKDLIGFGSWNKGFGVGVDLGVKYKLPLWNESLRPAIAITLQDVGNTRFTGGAEQMPMSFSVGGGITPSIGDVQLAIMSDFRELNRHTDFMSKFHAGVEAKFPEVIKTRFAVRAGCNQGYIATGLTAAWTLVSLNLAFYGEEAGEYTYSKPNYRFSTQVVFDF